MRNRTTTWLQRPTETEENVLSCSCDISYLYKPPDAINETGVDTVARSFLEVAPALPSPPSGLVLASTAPLLLCVGYGDFINPELFPPCFLSRICCLQCTCQVRHTNEWFNHFLDQYHRDSSGLVVFLIITVSFHQVIKIKTPAFVKAFRYVQTPMRSMLVEDDVQDLDPSQIMLKEGGKHRKGMQRLWL